MPHNALRASSRLSDLRVLVCSFKKVPTTIQMSFKRRSAGAKSGPLWLDRRVETLTRRLPIGADVERNVGVHFRVWAPAHTRVLVHLESGPGAPKIVSLKKDGAEGYFGGLSPDAAPGTTYRYQLDEDPARYPDPASRYQPDGPHGPSQVVDPQAFTWTDDDWRDSCSCSFNRHRRHSTRTYR